MKTSIRTLAVLVAVVLGLAGAAAAEEPVKPKPSGPVPLPYTLRQPSDAVAKPAMAPDAAALHAKLVKARADLSALASQPPPAGLSPRDAAALKAQQAESQRFAEALQDLTHQLEAGGSLDEVGQELQLRLHQVTARLEKADQAQSNALKKFMDLQGGILANLK